MPACAARYGRSNGCGRRLEQVQQELEQVTGNRRVMETEARVTPDQDAPKTIRSLDM